MPQSSGKTPPQRLDEFKFLLDSSLDRFVADALKLVGYDFTSVYNVWEGKDKVLDPEIISWAQANDRCWVHADDSYKRDHARQILTSQIRTILVYRKAGIMRGADQLRVLAWTLQEIMEKFRRHPARRHYILRVHGSLPNTRVAIDPVEMY